MSSATAEQAVSSSSRWRFLKNNAPARSPRVSLGPQREGAALRSLRSWSSQSWASGSVHLRSPNQSLSAMLCAGRSCSGPYCITSQLLLCNRVAMPGTQTGFINLRPTKSNKLLHLAKKEQHLLKLQKLHSICSWMRIKGEVSCKIGFFELYIHEGI